MPPQVCRQVTVRGVGLHTGDPSCVTLSAAPGPVRLRAGGLEAAIAELVVVGTERSTSVATRDGHLRVATVEHLFAALAGHGVHEGLILDVEGVELPLVDGSAAAWSEAIVSLGVDGARGPPMRIVRAGVVEVGASRFELEPAEETRVEVRVELDDDRISPEASWTGDADDFRRRIAPARTFARAADIELLLARGLARHVTPSSVVVLAPDAIHCSGPPFLPDEPARHKLLDLIGDMYLHGGPPLGRVRALRPGHAANATALARAVAEGIVARR